MKTDPQLIELWLLSLDVAQEIARSLLDFDAEPLPALAQKVEGSENNSCL